MKDCDLIKFKQDKNRKSEVPRIKMNYKYEFTVICGFIGHDSRTSLPQTWNDYQLQQAGRP
jgi:hypothetical protein